MRFLGIMARSLLLARRSISFIVVSVGGIFLSVMIASVIVSYSPTVLNLRINGYFRGIGYLKQPSFDHANGNRNEYYDFSAGPEVKNSSASAPILSVDKVSNNMAFSPMLSFDEVPAVLANAPTLSSHAVPNSIAFAPTLSFDEVSNTSAFAPALSLDKVLNTPASAPTLSFDEVSSISALAPALSLAELQEVQNSSSSGSAYGDDSKDPDMLDLAVFVDDSERNGSENGSGIVPLLNKTISAAAFPSPPSEDYEKLSAELPR